MSILESFLLVVSQVPVKEPSSEDIAEKFYKKIEHGNFDSNDPFIRNLRPGDVKMVETFKTRISKDRGDEFAENVILSYYEKIMERGVTWTSLADFLEVSEALSKSNDQFLKDVGASVREVALQFVLTNQASCPDEYKEICAAQDKKGNLLGKIAYHYGTGGASALLAKGWRDAVDRFGTKGVAGVDSLYRDGKITFVKIGGMQTGFDGQEVFVDGKKAAVLIVGDHTKGANVGVLMGLGGGVTVDAVEQDAPGSIVYQGPGGFQFYRKATELAIYNGEAKWDLPPNPRKHDGYVIIFPDGRLKIVDKRDISLAELTGRSEDALVRMNLRSGGPTDITRFKLAMRELNASMVPTRLIVKDGRVEWDIGNGPDERRVLAQFGDGTFAIISTITGGVTMGVNDMVMLLVRIAKAHGGLDTAVNLDTGQRDYTSYYQYLSGKGRVKKTIGWNDPKGAPIIVGGEIDDASDSQMCRIYFYQAEGGKK